MNRTIHIIDHDSLRTARTILQQKFYKIIQYYFEDTDAYLQNIKEGIESRNASAVVPAAHTIKSSSKQLGAEYMAVLALDMEQTAKNIMQGGDMWPVLDKMMPEMIRIYALTRQQMELALKDIL